MRGTIIKRSKSSWTAVVDLGPDPVTGKRRQLWRTIRGPKREAEARLAEMLHDRESGIEPPSRNLTVAATLERWLADYVAVNLAPKTAENYRLIVRRHLMPAIGSLALTVLRPSHVQGYYTRALQSGRSDGTGGLSTRSVLRHHQVLHAALHWAVRQQLLARNPVDAVDPPRPPRRELVVPDLQVVQSLLLAAEGSSYGPIIRLATFTGARRGELLALRWSDVDMDAGMLQIQRSMQRLTGQGMVVGQPKTARSRRAVALSPVAVQLLRQHRRQQAAARLLAGPAYRDGDLVFATGIGTPLEPGNLRRAWLLLLARAGLSPFPFHSLRHAHATLMLRNGVHPKIVSERLGHASIAITLDTYSHVVPGLQEAAAAQLDTLLATPAVGATG